MGFQMPDVDSSGHYADRNQPLDAIDQELVLDEDLLMEQILENINTSPVGKVLKQIALLPEVRRQKVLRVRRQLTEGSYNLNKRLDVVLDKVLEDLTA